MCFGVSHVPTKKGSTSTLPSVLITLWREGVEASFWPFLPLRESGLRQIWLPPYAFSRARAWVENIDRVVEVQKASSNLSSTGQAGTQAPIPLLLVAPLDHGSEPNNFRVNVSCDRFNRIVSAHAVRRRPLCPASMYMECATMALQNTKPTLDFSNYVLHFEQLRFEHPLGVDISRDVRLTLNMTTAPTTWKFVCSSSQDFNSHPGKLTSHAQGIIKLHEPVRWEAYQRLVSGRLKELISTPGVETLMSKRAYGLFSQVVDYHDILQGISTITMDGQQALAHIQVPEGHVGAAESTAIRLCDTVALDTFIQVAGLLINSGDNCSPGSCFIATGIDSVMLGSECNFESTKSWTVYAMYTMLNDKKAIGDVFILQRDHTIVGTVLGVSFSNLPIDILDNMLDGVNSPSSSKNSLYRVGYSEPRVSNTPSSSSVISDSSANDSGYSSYTSTALSSEQTSEASLRKLVTSYLGVYADKVPTDTPFSDLGLDSLAAVELASDIKSELRFEISSADLIQTNIRALSATLDAELAATSITMPSQKGVKRASPISARDFEEQTKRRSTACELIKEISGADLTRVSKTQTLRELGVDSLAVVQLKGDMESAFSLKLDGDDFHLDLELGKIWDLIGAHDSSPPENKPAAPNSTILDSTINRGANIPVHDSDNRAQIAHEVTSPACLGNLVEALHQSQLSLSSMADHCGYSIYWKTIARRENEILVTYILEAYEELSINLWELRPGEEVPTMKCLSKYERLIRRFSHILQKHSIIELTERSSWIRTPKSWPRVSSREQTNLFIEDFPNYQSEVELMAITGPKLAACLTGKADPVALLFSGRDSQAVLESFYSNSPMLATATELLVDVVKRSISAASGETVRILEIGAGCRSTLVWYF